MVESKIELSKCKEHVCRDPKCALVHRKGPGPPAIFLPTTSPPTKDPGPQSSFATHQTLLKMAFCIMNGFKLGRSREAVFFLHRKITTLVAPGQLTHNPPYNPQFRGQVCGNS
jgi:hypothetical protein